MFHHSVTDKLRNALGLPGDAAEADEHDGAVALRYGDGLLCILSVDGNGNVLASTPIAFVRTDSRVPLFERALHLNGNWRTVADGLIGYDAVLSQLEYSTRIPACLLDPDAFPDVLGRFLTKAMELRAMLT